jgi:probable phosphoglycerate mutase
MAAVDENSITRAEAELAIGNVLKCKANCSGSRDMIRVSCCPRVRSFGMKHVALILSIPLLLASAAAATPVIFIVRHAEKATAGGNDPDLSVAGRKRAEALARILKDARITDAFVTEFKRTQETAAPTAKAAHVTPTVVPANDVPGLAAKLRAVKGNALVVGHGNTIPDLVKALGIAEPTNIPEDDYAEIFVVSVGDAPQLLRLHYPF